MAFRYSGSVVWTATFTVDGSSWTPHAFAGLWLFDASNTRILIVDNSATTLYLARVQAPVIGKHVTFGSPGWTVNQYQNGRYVNGVPIRSYLYDSSDDPIVFTIYGNTADTMLVSVADPLRVDDSPTPPIFLGDGGQITDLGSPSDAGAGVWSIQADDGTVEDDWIGNTGAVSATEGGTELDVTIPGLSVAIDLECIDTLSLNACVATGTVSSPTGTLAWEAINTTGPDMGGIEGAPGPSPLDPFWTPVKVSPDGAVAAASLAITSGAPHIAVPMVTPVSSVGVTRYGRCRWTPGGSPGTGNLTVKVYGTGPD